MKISILSISILLLIIFIFKIRNTIVRLSKLNYHAYNEINQNSKSKIPNKFKEKIIQNITNHIYEILNQTETESGLLIKEIKNKKNENPKKNEILEINFTAEGPILHIIQLWKKIETDVPEVKIVFLKIIRGKSEKNDELHAAEMHLRFEL